MLQKIIKVGNSAALTIPQDFLKKAGWKVGDAIAVDADKTERVIFIKEPDSTFNTKLTPEFKEWLDEIGRKYKKTIKELAQR